MKTLLFLIPIILSGCTVLPYSSRINKNLGEEEVQLKWKVVNNIQQACKNFGLKENLATNLIGCTTFHGKYCTIYTDKEPHYEVLGKGLTTCFENKNLIFK